MKNSELLSEREAAEFCCGLEYEYFKNLRRTGHGPNFVRPSPHTTMYRKENLEAWIASWPTKPTMNHI
jgi:hypothetical protein